MTAALPKAPRRALAGAALALGLLLGAPQAGAQELDPNLFQAQMSNAGDWLADQIAVFSGLGIKVLPMGDANLKAFARALTGDRDGSRHVGEDALAALLDERSVVNGKPRPTCFLLYNPQQARVLESQFFAPARRIDAEGAAQLFVVAHEAGHCVDFLDKAQPPGPKAEEDLKRWWEYGADLFGALTLMDAGARAESIEAILRIRSGTRGAHATAPALDALLAQWRSGAIGPSADARARWELAKRLRAQAFR